MGNTNSPIKPVSEEEFSKAEGTYIADETWIKQCSKPDAVLFYQAYTVSGIAALQQFSLS